jgi:hypothetical protein
MLRLISGGRSDKIAIGSEAANTGPGEWGRFGGRKTGDRGVRIDCLCAGNCNNLWISVA